MRASCPPSEHTHVFVINVLITIIVICEFEPEVLQHLADQSLGLKRRRIILVFDESTIPAQSSRSGQMAAFLAISDAMTADGKRLKSVFAKSKLWLRACVTGLPMMRVDEYVNPTTRLQKTDFVPSKDLSRSLRQKQHLSGWRIFKEIQARIWDGTGATSEDVAVWVDTHSFDGSLAEAIMRTAATATAKEPRQMCASAVWAKTDLEGHQQAVNAQIAAFVLRSNQGVLQDLLRNGQYQISGWVEEKWVEGTPAPSVHSSEYKACFPTQGETLAIRDEWLREQKHRLKSSQSHLRLEELVKKHNQIYNPTGALHAGEAPRGQKRMNPDQGGPTDAVEVPPEDGCPSSMEELKQAFPDSVVLELFGQEFIFTTCAKLFVHGKTDDIISSREPLVKVMGKFLPGAKAAAYEEQGGKGFDINFTSGEDLIFGTMLKAGSMGQFKAELSPLKDFVVHLQTSGVAPVKMECFNLALTFPKDSAGDITGCVVSIERTTRLLFTPELLGPGKKESFDNIGSRLVVGPGAPAWDWEQRTHNSGWLRVFPHIRYEGTRQYSGIVPAKPGIYLTKDVRVVAGTIRRWA